MLLILYFLICTHRRKLLLHQNYWKLLIINLIFTPRTTKIVALLRFHFPGQVDLHRKWSIRQPCCILQAQHRKSNSNKMVHTCNSILIRHVPHAHRTHNTWVYNIHFGYNYYIYCAPTWFATCYCKSGINKWYWYMTMKGCQLSRFKFGP